MNKLLFAAVMTACVAAATPYDSNSGPQSITGSMMTPVSSGTPTTVTGAGSAWSLNVENQGWSEGYAYVTLEVAPNTRVQITGGTLQNTITGSWYWGDIVMFASAVNPASAIMGKLPGPMGSIPAPGVMAWMSNEQYGNPANYATGLAANYAGYRYFGGGDGFGSYRDAIGGYSSNVENFRAGGLDINGGTFAGWNEVTTPPMTNGSPARALTEILYPTGGLNRALQDQTYAFDGAVNTGSSRTYVTIMVRGGGAQGGSILVNNLGVSFSAPDTLKITGSMMTPVSSGTPTTVTGTGSAWSLNVENQGWSEGYAYTTFMVPPNTKVQLTGGTLQNTITGSWYWGDLLIFTTAVNPESAIAGKVAGPTGSTPAPGVMAWMSDSQYDASFATATKADANNAGYRYFGGGDGFNSYREAIGGYSSNVENFRDGGLAINGGAFAGWNEVSGTMPSPSAIRPLTEIQFAAGGWLNRALKDQTYAFDGSVVTPPGTENMYVTIMVRGGGAGGGSISVDNLAVSFSTIGSLEITGSMMTPVSGNSAVTVTGTDSAWSLNAVGSDGSEGYAYTTFMVPPNTKVQLTGGTLQNTFSGSWYFGDLLILASEENPKNAIAGKVAGPYGSNPPPYVMAWISDAQYKAANYKYAYQAKAAVNNAGYRYYGGGDGYSSYLAAIGQYSSNVENFRDGGLAINGGVYAAWNQASSPSMASGTSARSLTEIIYPAWGGLNRPLKDQTYAFDGAVYTGNGPANRYVTVMLRGGGGVNSGSISACNLTVTFSNSDTLPLTIDRQADQVVLTWPGDAYGMVAEETAALQGDSTVWTAITEQPTLVGGVWTLSRPAEPGERFYRLRVK